MSALKEQMSENVNHCQPYFNNFISPFLWRPVFNPAHKCGFSEGLWRLNLPNENKKSHMKKEDRTEEL